MSLIYIDTNIYLDYFEGRTDYLRPLGEFAFQIFQRTLSCEFTVAMTGFLMKELSKYAQAEQLSELTTELKEKNKLRESNTTKDDIEKARSIVKEKKTSFPDTLHAVVAQRMGAEYLVTRNVRDFLELQDMVKIILPEHL